MYFQKRTLASSSNTGILEHSVTVTAVVHSESDVSLEKSMGASGRGRGRGKGRGKIDRCTEQCRVAEFASALEYNVLDSIEGASSAAIHPCNLVFNTTGYPKSSEQHDHGSPTNCAALVLDTASMSPYLTCDTTKICFKPHFWIT